MGHVVDMVLGVGLGIGLPRLLGHEGTTTAADGPVITPLPAGPAGEAHDGTVAAQEPRPREAVDGASPPSDAPTTHDPPATTPLALAPASAEPPATTAGGRRQPTRKKTRKAPAAGGSTPGAHEYLPPSRRSG